MKAQTQDRSQNRKTTILAQAILAHAVCSSNPPRVASLGACSIARLGHAFTPAAIAALCTSEGPPCFDFLCSICAQKNFPEFDLLPQRPARRLLLPAVGAQFLPAIREVWGRSPARTSPTSYRLRSSTPYPTSSGRIDEEELQDDSLSYRIRLQEELPPTVIEFSEDLSPTEHFDIATPRIHDVRERVSALKATTEATQPMSTRDDQTKTTTTIGCRSIAEMLLCQHREQAQQQRPIPIADDDEVIDDESPRPGERERGEADQAGQTTTTTTTKTRRKFRTTTIGREPPEQRRK